MCLDCSLGLARENSAETHTHLALLGFKACREGWDLGRGSGFMVRDTKELQMEELQFDRTVCCELM